MPVSDTDLLDTICLQWRSLNLDTDYEALQITGRLLRLGKNIEYKLARLHRDYGLQQGEFDVLATLKRCGVEVLTPSQLYQTMLLSSGAMTSRLDRLEKKELIQRQHCQQDRRSIQVSLTAKGHEVIELIYPAHFQLVSQLLNGQTLSQKQHLATLLKHWLLTLETKGTASS